MSIAITIYVVVAVFLLTRSGFNTLAAVFCAILMFVPCVSLIVLLIVNQRTTSILQQNGYRVGLFEADPSD